MSLDQFLKRYATNDNEWWKLGPGEMQNLFDEAIWNMELLKAKNAQLCAVLEAHTKKGTDNAS